MTAKCIDCNLHWNVSVKREIPPEGYVCPWCNAKRKVINNKKDKQ